MTHRRIIAGVILLAALAVAVPLVPNAWERMVYRFDKVGPGRLKIKVKRFDWMPGDTRNVIDQECPECMKGRHGQCWMGLPSLRGQLRILSQDGAETTLRQDFRCTCTDPSHDGDSE